MLVLCPRRTKPLLPQVLDTKEVVNRGNTKLVEAMVGDATACIILTLRNE